MISFIIPSFNQPHHLISTLESVPLLSPFQLVVCDTSTDDLARAEVYRYCLGKRIPLYVTQERGLAPHIAIMDAVREVKTPYVMMVGHDDYFNLSAVNDCLKFLEGNREYSTAFGLYAGFQETEGQYYDLGEMHGHTRTIDQETPTERVVNLFSNYFHTLYGVHRTAYFRKAHYLVADAFGDKELLFPEVALCAIYAAQGKQKKIEAPFYARRRGNSIETERRISWAQMKESPDFRAQMNKFLDALSVVHPFECDELKRIEGAFLQYVEGACNG